MQRGIMRVVLVGALAVASCGEDHREVAPRTECLEGVQLLRVAASTGDPQGIERAVADIAGTFERAPECREVLVGLLMREAQQVDFGGEDDLDVPVAALGALLALPVEDGWLLWARKSGLEFERLMVTAKVDVHMGDGHPELSERQIEALLELVGAPSESGGVRAAAATAVGFAPSHLLDPAIDAALYRAARSRPQDDPLRHWLDGLLVVRSIKVKEGENR